MSRIDKDEGPLQRCPRCGVARTPSYNGIAAHEAVCDPRVIPAAAWDRAVIIEGVAVEVVPPTKLLPSGEDR